MMLRHAFATAISLGALCSCLVVPRSARAHEGTLATCVARAVQSTREQGARPHGAPVVEFLLTGDELRRELVLPEAGCLGVLAVGHRQVQQLGLTLFAPSGRVLAQGEGRGAHVYARFCGDAGRSFVAELRMLDGSGEVHLVPLWNAPLAPADLQTIMASCMHTGDPRPDPVDVGPEPLGPPIDVELSAVAKQLASLGYRLEGGLLFGGLPERRREVRRVLLESGQCYALAAIGDGDVEDIDMRLLSVSETTSLVAADTTRRRDAVVKVCPEHAGVYVLDVRMYRGSGSYIVQSFGLVEPVSAPPPGIEGSTRIPYAEMVMQMRERGMRASPMVWGLLQPRATQTIPLPMERGRCYAIGAVATPDFAGADLDMSLLDSESRLQAAEIGPNPHPLVFHCSDRDQVARVVLHGQEVRRPSRFLLLYGEQEGAQVPVR